MTSLRFSERTASRDDIILHLKKCNKNFIPNLDKEVNIEAYSSKIFEKAITFEAWNDKTLVGLVAAYFNDQNGHKGYITNVSTDKLFWGKGIAKILIKLCVDYGKTKGFNIIFLEVSKLNIEALKLYKKYNFNEYEAKVGSIIMRHDIQ